MLDFVRRQLTRLLCSKLAGRLLAKLFSHRIPCPRYGRLRFDCSEGVAPETAASIFWGAYEGAEIRLARKWVDRRRDVVELGGSIGVLACHIASWITPRRLVTVEPSPELCRVIERNLRMNHIANATVMSGAVAISAVPIFFRPGSINTTGTVTSSAEPGTVPVVSMTLAEIAREHGMRDYTLVCDIEGSEVAMLSGDPAAFRDCALIIMEAHQTNRNGRRHEVEETVRMVCELGFELVDGRGRTFVFSRASQTGCANAIG